MIFEKHGQKYYSDKHHPNWQGNKIGYYGIHHWLRKEYENANKCENPECLGKSNHFEWALIKGKKYERKRKNFWMLCHSCHRNYDYTEKWREKQRKNHKGTLGYKHSEESKRKMSESMKGRIPWNKKNF